ncbi:D-glycerate dehydrogenase [Candidatus Bathyarchaeota archaeon]|nr:D-glycerate dehydrogenase [Candidatus Bathyarchaeota archaeon]
MKSLVLISPDKRNVPENVSQKLKPLADVIYLNKDLEDHIEGAEALLVGGETIDDDFLDKAPKLGIAARFGVGYDSVDVEACTKRGVYVAHTPDVLSAGVADHTWALILGFMRHIPEADKYVRKEWANRERRLEFGWELKDKTLGILGLGSIGREVLKRAQGFDMRLVYNDVVRKRDLEKEFGVQFVDKEELLRASDILSIHVPLLESTRHSIGSHELSIMKPSALIVNTSRGQVIDEDALYEALKDGKIKGAALDVFYEEPTPLHNPLLELENVVLSPHCASATWETRRKMAELAVDNIRAYLEGERPPTLVPEQREKL